MAKYVTTKPIDAIDTSAITRFMDNQSEINDDTLQILKLHNDRMHEMMTKIDKLERRNKVSKWKIGLKTSR